MTRYLSIEEILRLHFQVIEDFGGSHGVRDENRLLSMVNAPVQEVFGQKQYPDLFSKAATYTRNIIGDHPFVDGNKRTAITCAGIFLMRNGFMLTATQDELEDFAVRVAVDKLNIEQIVFWFKSHASKT